MQVLIKKLREWALIPKYQTPEAAGMDLSACWEVPESGRILWPGQRMLIPTGLSIQVPLGFEGTIRPRSGLALREGVTVLNSPGTIDSDYRGEVGVILINHGTDALTIKNGDRIAQIVFTAISIATLAEVTELETTERGGGGFGSTG